jgi:pimeloyl-ACP methyl ester carboxylesterase
MTALAEAALAAAPARFALAGLSMGGYVAFEIMRKAPERVERLALLDTQARPDTPEAADRRRGLVAIARKGDFEAVLSAVDWTNFVARTRAADDHLEAIIYGMAEEVGAAAYIRQQMAIIARPDSRGTLGSIRCPTLVLVGDDDRITPPEVAREMADGIAGAVLAIIPDCGHLSTLERPDAVTRELEAWLNRPARNSA